VRVEVLGVIVVRVVVGEVVVRAVNKCFARCRRAAEVDDGVVRVLLACLLDRLVFLCA
jgi:hypothetical protein